MALAPNALFVDPDVVWTALCQEEDVRVEHADTMIRWINFASAFLERLFNRKLKPTVVTEILDGNSRPIMTLRETPSNTLHSLRVYDSNFDTFDDIAVNNAPDASPEIAFDGPRGRLILLPDAPIARFTLGVDNVHVTHSTGFPQADVAVFQEAAIELISQRWNDLGRNPIEIIRSDSTNTIATFNRADFDELPFVTRQSLELYRKWSV